MHGGPHTRSRALAISLARSLALPKRECFILIIILLFIRRINRTVTVVAGLAHGQNGFDDGMAGERETMNGKQCDR